MTRTVRAMLTRCPMPQALIGGTSSVPECAAGHARQFRARPVHDSHDLEYGYGVDKVIRISEARASNCALMPPHIQPSIPSNGQFGSAGSRQVAPGDFGGNFNLMQMDWLGAAIFPGGNRNAGYLDTKVGQRTFQAKGVSTSSLRTRIRRAAGGFGNVERNSLQDVPKLPARQGSFFMPATNKNPIIRCLPNRPPRVCSRIHACRSFRARLKNPATADQKALRGEAPAKNGPTSRDCPRCRTPNSACY